MAAPGPYEGDPTQVPPELLDAAQGAGGPPVEAAGDPSAPPEAPPPAPAPPEPSAIEAIEHAIVKMAEAASMAANGQEAQGFGTGVRNLAEAHAALVNAELRPRESEADVGLKSAQTVAALRPPPAPGGSSRPGESAPSRS